VLEAATGVAAAHLRGAHLRLPGYGDGGPTLEIYTYEALSEHPGLAVTRPGWGHIAFQVPDVERALEVVVEAGGGRAVSWCYVTDPDGNIVELQHWTTRTE
jgi:catechol 2,3-dioxygenase-like lactoylglutathione lyase family enzyme